MAIHLQMRKLVVLYSANNITIKGGTVHACTEDRAAHFTAFAWHVQRVTDGHNRAAMRCRRYR